MAFHILNVNFIRRIQQKFKADCNMTNSAKTSEFSFAVGREDRSITNPTQIELYTKHVTENKLSMYIFQMSGDRIHIYWNANKMEVHDRLTGEVYVIYKTVTAMLFSMKIVLCKGIMS